MYSIVDYGEMITDEIRMDPYAYALKAMIGPDSVVLDIGTGTGIHALLACKFGARKVYAIEPNEAIHLARNLAQANGFADRIEFIQGISTRITLSEKADVIVSDLRGVLPLYQGHITSIIDARQRHLAPGGVLIPRRDTISVALVEARSVYDEITKPWHYPYGLAMEEAKQIVLNSWVEESTVTFSKSNLLMEPQIWTVLDYSTIESPDVEPLDVTRQATRDGTAHGLWMWFDAEITDELRINNGPQAEKAAKVYGCGFFPLLKPVVVNKGDTITLNLCADLIEEQYVWRWHTRIHSGDNPQNIKADFEQSTDLYNGLDSAVLHQQVLDRRPARSQAGEIDHFILEQMDGRKTVEQIARQVQEKYPIRFKTERDAQFYVNDLSQEYG